MDQGTQLTISTFSIVVEPDEDRWRAYCPALEAQGAATWGRSRAEAEAHLREVLAMVRREIASDLAEEPLPGELEALDEAEAEFARGE